MSVHSFLIEGRCARKGYLIFCSKMIKVLLSGGRENFYPNDTVDVEYAGKVGRRTDGYDLIQVSNHN